MFFSFFYVPASKPPSKASSKVLFTGLEVIAQVPLTTHIIYDIRPVQYTGLAYLNGQIQNDTAREILSHKLNVWAYEEERVFIADKYYADVKIHQVITGRAMSNQDFSFIRDIIERINPSIELIKAQSYM